MLGASSVGLSAELAMIVLFKAGTPLCADCCLLKRRHLTAIFLAKLPWGLHINNKGQILWFSSSITMENSTTHNHPGANKYTPGFKYIYVPLLSDFLLKQCKNIKQKKVTPKEKKMHLAPPCLF